MLIEGPGGEFCKISGSAFKQTRANSLHHFSLLIDSDLEALGHYLRPTMKPSKDRSIPSVRSRVTTLRKVAPRLCRHSFWPAFREYLENKGHRPWGGIYDARQAQRKAMELMDWKWVIGETPAFDYREKDISFSSSKEC